jgi:hypothetical protein
MARPRWARHASLPLAPDPSALYARYRAFMLSMKLLSVACGLEVSAALSGSSVCGAGWPDVKSFT